MVRSKNEQLLTQTVLILFREKITYDSLLVQYNMHIGSNMRRNFNEE